MQWKKKKIAVAGLGYVGLANAVLLAQHNQVWAFDTDKKKMDCLRGRSSPIADPEIESALGSGKIDLVPVSDPEAAYQNISPDSFTITICHTPDTVLQIPQDQTDLMLAGHSHGGQVVLPFFGPLYKPSYAERYYRGQSQIGDILLDVSNGTGTTRMDIRLFAPAEIVVFQLVHEEPEATALPSGEPETTPQTTDQPQS